ncbi:hypothetical protein A9Q99_25325 [Gammaproteobacteria bacterium 45_16_T64]|nr:hypothetical protein A9Q99_25325 [Gammaproteobacteria bacterium 45_16_T64]
MKLLHTLTYLLLSYLVSAPSAADEVQLSATTFSDGSHQYYHELLLRALEQNGHQLSFDNISDKSQQWITASLRRGLLSIHWFLQTKERDELFIPIKVNLTNGLIGNRVLLIPKNSQPIYDNISNLAEFRELNLSSALGKNWYDAKVWKHNSLKYLEIVKWRNIYSMLESKNRGIDYFPRGVNEILPELREHPNLEIEKNLVFSYDRDFIFYLAKSKSHLQPIIEQSLLKARDSGLMNTLIEHYWYENLSQLNVKHRTPILLKTP